MTRRFGFALVGAGLAATPHAQALAALADRIAVRGVFTRNRERAAAFAERFGFPVADDLDALTADPEVDALLLLTPPDTRLDLIERFAALGKHVLCEKPLGRTVADAEDIAGICARHGVGLGVVFQHRYRPEVRRLRELLATGALGAVGMVQVDVPWWRPQSYYDEPGRGTYTRDGGGVLITQAIHTLDLLLSLAGPVQSVQALTANTPLHRMEAEDFAAGGLAFENGAVGALMATTAAFPGGGDAIRLHGEHGSAHLQSGVLRVAWRDGRDETFGATTGTGGGADPMAFPFDWHRDLIAGFVEQVGRGEAPPVAGDGAVAVQRLIEALLRSSREGRRIAVPTSEDSQP